MSNLVRKIERRRLKKEAKALQGGTDALRRFLGGVGEVKNVSEAVALLNEVKPIVQDCRDAAFTAIQHIQVLERALAKERHVRRMALEMVQAGSQRPISLIEEQEGAAWEAQNPLPTVETTDAETNGG